MEPITYTLIAGAMVVRGNDQYNLEMLARIYGDDRHRYQISMLIVRHHSVVDPGRNYLEVRRLNITTIDAPQNVPPVQRNPQYPSRSRSPRRQ